MVTRDGYDGHNDGSSARLGNAASTGNGLAWNECTFFFVSLSRRYLYLLRSGYVQSPGLSYLPSSYFLASHGASSSARAGIGRGHDQVYWSSMTTGRRPRMARGSPHLLEA